MEAEVFSIANKKNHKTRYLHISRGHKDRNAQSDHHQSSDFGITLPVGVLCPPTSGWRKNISGITERLDNQIDLKISTVSPLIVNKTDYVIWRNSQMCQPIWEFRKQFIPCVCAVHNRIKIEKLYLERKIDNNEKIQFKHKKTVLRLHSVAFMSSVKGRLSISSSSTNMSSDIPSNSRRGFSLLGASSRTVRRSAYVARQTREDNLKRIEAHQSLLFQLRVLIWSANVIDLGIRSRKYASV